MRHLQDVCEVTTILAAIMASVISNYREDDHLLTHTDNLSDTHRVRAAAPIWEGHVIP